MYEKRGVIKYISRKQQINSFHGLIRHNNITPTDIDGVIDYGGKNFIYLEGKLINAKLPGGQKKAFEKIICSHCRAGNQSVFIVYEHETEVSETVDVANCYVKEYFGRSKGELRWHIPSRLLTVLQAIEIFEVHFKIV